MARDPRNPVDDGGGARRGLPVGITTLSRTVSRMDGGTLDRLWEAALRGDMVLAEQILADHRVSEDIPGTPQWSETSSWLFGRVSRKR